MKPKNTICLWFDKDAHEAARFYAATFPDSEVTSVHQIPADYPGGKKGDVLITTGSQQTLQFYPLPPCRVADTRNTTDFASGLGSPYLMGNMQRVFPVLNASMNKSPLQHPQ